LKVKIGLFFLFLLFLIKDEFSEKLSAFIVWFFSINANDNSISVIGEIFVKFTTVLVSYNLVVLLFNALGWYNSAVMKLVYFIVSTLVSFVFSYGVMLLEAYIKYIAVGLLVIVLSACLIVGCLLIREHLLKRKQQKIETKK